MAYPVEQIGNVDVCSDEVYKWVNAFNHRLLRRTWQLEVSDKSYQISHDFGHTVKIIFARNHQDKFMNFLLIQLIIWKTDYSMSGNSSTHNMHLLVSISDPSDFGGLK